MGGSGKGKQCRTGIHAQGKGLLMAFKASSRGSRLVNFTRMESMWKAKASAKGCFHSLAWLALRAELGAVARCSGAVL
jgi:hypothetical protein